MLIFWLANLIGPLQSELLSKAMDSENGLEWPNLAGNFR